MSQATRTSASRGVAAAGAEIRTLSPGERGDLPMETALHIGLANVVVAGAVAVIATVASLARGRPALAHALWLLVLLKLLTPPLWGVSVERLFGSRAHLAAA